MKRPFTALAMLATPEEAPVLGDLDLWRVRSSGTRKEELSESFLFLAGIVESDYGASSPWDNEVASGTASSRRKEALAISCW